jgi:hypothetical protein
MHYLTYNIINMTKILVIYPIQIYFDKQMDY